MKKLAALLILIALNLFPVITSAHPGRTASDGCHYCRTNCSSWGEVQGARHCHGGGSPYTPPVYKTPVYTAPVYTPPKVVVCQSGHALLPDKQFCVPVPENAHAVETSTDAWICDDGYKEVGSSCVLKENCEKDGYTTNISRVIDGDTIEFLCGTTKEKIRIIGIDTPETVHPSKPVQCFGKEASTKMNQLVLNKTVTLKKGSQSDNRGSYGRLLRYVFVGSTDIGGKMISNGYAFSYVKYPHEKLDQYNLAETTARENNKGLWNHTACPENSPEPPVVKEVVPVVAKVTHDIEEEVKKPGFWGSIWRFFSIF